MFSDHGGSGHEFADGIGRMTRGQLAERFSQPSVRVDDRDLEVFDDVAVEIDMALRLGSARGYPSG